MCDPRFKFNQKGISIKITSIGASKIEFSDSQDKNI